MSEILIHTAGGHQVTCVPNAFIDEYMHDANGEFVKVYLYLLRMLCQDEGRFSITAMADKFNYTESDIRRGLSYWEKMHLLHLEYDPAGDLVGICLMEPQGCSHVRVSNAQASMPAAPMAEPTAPAFVAPEKRMISQPSSYSPTEILAFQEQDDVQELLMVSERYIGHTLSMTDINTILYWFDQLHFSTELIEYLVEYCVEKGHASIHYMNKVALDWAENGILTLEDAKQNTNIHSQSYYAVMKAFGISGRNLVRNEIAFIEKWTNLYGFTLDIINEACARTIRNTGKANFEYADSILTSWHKNNIRHLEDVANSDKAYSASKQTKNTVKPAKTNNRFHNFEQRQYDFDDLEQKLLRK